MKTFRYGFKINAVGDEWYSVERKTWYGWTEIHRFKSKSKMMNYVRQLQHKGFLIIET